VFFSIYRAVISKPDTVVPDDISKTIDATLDKKTIDLVRAKLFLEDSQIPSITFTGTLPQVSSSPSPVATSAATPVPSPEAVTTATPSATLAP
jgi:hypothetical protein